MQVIYPGHKYQLDNSEVSDSYQELQFIQKEYNERLKAFLLIRDGVQNIEVLKCLLDRYQYLESILYCDSNSRIIALLKEAIALEESRDRDRKIRSVEGTNVS